MKAMCESPTVGLQLMLTSGLSGENY